MDQESNNKCSFKLPTKKELRLAVFAFNKKEMLIFCAFGLILLISTLAILQNINQSYMVSVPIHGGSITEGTIGTARFINPVLANTDADKDLSMLIYSGLMRKNTDGTLSPDIASSYDISQDGLSYTFNIRDNIYFHDRTLLTADDIIFTIEAIKDPIIKSPHRGDWEGVSVEKIDDKTITFHLKKPYASFLENMTIGIMPKNLWKDSPLELNELNTNPVGTGPYKVSKINKESSGVVNSYELKAYDKFNLGQAYISKFILKLYSNEDELMNAFNNKEIDQLSSISPENANILKSKGGVVESSVLPRIFGLFFNQNENQIFTNKDVVTAINLVIDKDEIVSEVLGGYGITIEDPIPENLIAYQKIKEGKELSHEDKIKRAESILAKDGWVKNADGFLEKTTTTKQTTKVKGKSSTSVNKSTTLLEFSISTGNVPELAESANLIAKDLQALGMKVDVKTFETGDLNQNIIRPRKYDALLFGQIINHESDLFAFWHSSQRKDPGLNVALYTNAKVDKILEDAFVTIDEKSRIKKYAQFEDEIIKDQPAVFLYSPNYIYVVAKNIKDLNIDHITSPADRFANIYKWYNQTDNVWKIFAK